MRQKNVATALVLLTIGLGAVEVSQPSAWAAVIPRPLGTRSSIWAESD